MPKRIMNHAKYERVMSHMHELCQVRMSGVTSIKNKCVWMSPVTYEQVRAHLDELCHISMRHDGLQHVTRTAMHCHTLQHNARVMTIFTMIHTLQRTATHCNTLQYTARAESQKNRVIKFSSCSAIAVPRTNFVAYYLISLSSGSIF